MNLFEQAKNLASWARSQHRENPPVEQHQKQDRNDVSMATYSGSRCIDLLLEWLESLQSNIIIKTSKIENVSNRMWGTKAIVDESVRSMSGETEQLLFALHNAVCALDSSGECYRLKSSFPEGISQIAEWERKIRHFFSVECDDELVEDSSKGAQLKKVVLLQCLPQLENALSLKCAMSESDNKIEVAIAGMFDAESQTQQLTTERLEMALNFGKKWCYTHGFVLQVGNYSKGGLLAAGVLFTPNFVSRIFAEFMRITAVLLVACYSRHDEMYFLERARQKMTLVFPVSSYSVDVVEGLRHFNTNAFLEVLRCMGLLLEMSSSSFYENNQALFTSRVALMEWLEFAIGCMEFSRE